MGSAQGGAGRSLLTRMTSGINLGFSHGGSCVGLSIGASSIKIAELSKKKKGQMERL